MNSQLANEIKKEYQQRFPAKKFIPGESVVPVSGKVFNEKEILLMVEAVLEGWWTEGHSRSIMQANQLCSDFVRTAHQETA